MQCMVLKGDLPLKINWHLNDKPITTVENGISVGLTSSRISQLTIESVTAYHRGIYRCTAENRAGQAEATAELRVNGIKAFIFSDHFHLFLFWLMSWSKFFRSLNFFPVDCY